MMLTTQTTITNDYNVDFPNFEIEQHRDLNAPRFVTQFVYDKLSVDTDAVPNRVIPRGVIMPVVSFRQVLPLVEIREADLIPGSERADPITGRPYLGQVWRRAQIEADRLIDLEAQSEYKSGIREIRALQKLPATYVRQINQLFWGGVDRDALETNAAMRAHLVARTDEIRTNPPAQLKKDEVAAFVECGQELIEAVEYADRLQRRSLEVTHTRMKLPPSDGDHKRCYDEVDEIFLKRTGMKRLSEVDQQLAGALERLANGQSGGADTSSALIALVAEIKRSNDLREQELALLGNGKSKR